MSARQFRYVIEKMTATPYTYETVCVLALMWETKLVAVQDSR